MSVNISVSNTKQVNCNNIIEKMLSCGFNSRIIDTISIVDSNIERGCLITLGKEYNTISQVNKIWNTIKNDYECAHLKIDGLFDGCILNFLTQDKCPGGK